jgi:hypothetical protein
MCLWSFALLTQGPTQYYTYRQFLTGIEAAFTNLIDLHFFVLPALVLAAGVLATQGYGHSSLAFKNIATALILLLLVHYQCTIFFFDKMGMTGCSLISLAFVFVIVAGYFTVFKVFQEHSLILLRTFGILSVICYLALIGLFANLTITTNQIMLAKLPSQPAFAHISRVDVNEVRASLLEYMNVAGFDEK